MLILLLGHCTVFISALSPTFVEIMREISIIEILCADHSDPAVFARSNAGVVVSNPTRGRISVCVYSVFVLSCIGSGLATGLIPRPRSPTDCLKDP
jgi:hypothetical protein